MTPLPIERWHEIVKTRDIRALDELLADAVTFQSPVVHTPQVGKVITGKYLAAAMHVLNNTTFKYRKEWYGKSSAVLEFQCTLEDAGNAIEVNGVDIIEWDADGRISNFKVMVRPLKAMNTLHALMGRTLQPAPAKQ